ncbi:guanylin-like [Leucoraja erinacea]|uniref:guanylin-like n=1 Tax=Leucoraja erinaceus TaxID=7782 RepID=UPI002458EA12|nr:guanylin-like [Leucoraja erinacea]
MKTPFSLLLAISCMSSILANVIVQDGIYSFPLKDVKQLWALMDAHAKDNPVDSSSSLTGLCHSSELPKAFHTVCAAKDTAQVFLRLEEIARKADHCEICAYAACTGCENGGSIGINQN